MPQGQVSQQSKGTRLVLTSRYPKTNFNNRRGIIIMSYLFWLIKQAVSGMMHSYLIAIILLVNIALSLVIRSRVLQQLSISNLMFLLCPFLFSAVVLMVGVVFKHVPTSDTTPLHYPVYIIYVVALFHLTLTSLNLYRFRDLRYFTFSLSLLQLYCFFWLGLVSYMSVTGDWI